MATSALINPNVLVQRNDPFTTGIIYMPIGLAYVAASLRHNGLPVKVIDAFGEAPRQVHKAGDFMVLGLSTDEVIARIPADAGVIFVYANQLINHASVAEIIRAAKNRFPQTPVVVLENTQAVTAYALRPVAADLFATGADYLLSGEGEERAVQLVQAIGRGATAEELSEIDGLCWPGRDSAVKAYNRDLDALPFPAWDLFPLDGYWSLRFAHGPQSARKYLPMLTTRGCPYPCRFCVVPATNDRTWRHRSGKNVADEMAYMKERFGVSEFHWEDLNPTINDRRMRALCEEIISRDLGVTWKIVAGTKVESMRTEETVSLMAKAGCRYVSISPESGSKKVRRLIEKPFSVEHATRLIHEMNRVGIRSQACFVLGFPGEDDEDRALTRELIKDLVRNGIDEIAIFIISPVPGSEIFKEFSGYKSLSELNFTPTWRDDYEMLNRLRINLYLSFLGWKLRYYPLKILRQGINFLMRRFETKMEMVPYKALVYKMMQARA
ncbi:MAG: B12-binding domain-containing radical SAM protein [Alphaproteobacteria bacterium]|nr:MAG: B12-binding domain-containing radical SAM protein [Alphaproteobacteria bacterium]